MLLLRAQCSDGSSPCLLIAEGLEKAVLREQGDQSGPQVCPGGGLDQGVDRTLDQGVDRTLDPVLPARRPLATFTWFLQPLHVSRLCNAHSWVVSPTRETLPGVYVALAQRQSL